MYIRPLQIFLEILNVQYCTVITEYTQQCVEYFPTKGAMYMDVYICSTGCIHKLFSAMYRDRQNVVLFTRFSKLFSINIQYCVYCINNLVHGRTVHSTDRQATYSLHTVFSTVYWVYRKYCTECTV